jgi:hypothetical protein
MRNLPHLQFRIRNLMMSIVLVACALALIRWAGPIIAIPIVVIPFSLLFERIFGTPPTGSLRLSPASPSTKAFVILMVIVAMGALLLISTPWMGLVLTLAVMAILSGLLVERPSGAHPSATTGLAIARDFVILTSCASACTFLAWYLSLVGIPTVVSPLPVIIFLPTLYAVEQLRWTQPWWIVPPLLVGTFFLLNFYQLRVASLDFLPMRFSFLLAVATAFSTLWFVLGWEDAVQYEGPVYTRSLAAINVLFLAVLWGWWLALRRRPSRGGAFAFAALLHGWLFSYAFPWLGELL